MIYIYCLSGLLDITSSILREVSACPLDIKAVLFRLVIFLLEALNTDGIVLKILYKERNVPLDINHIGRSHPIGETKDGKISIIVRFLTYRPRPII
jgi:hypothetical protein